MKLLSPRMCCTVASVDFVTPKEFDDEVDPIPYP